MDSINMNQQEYTHENLVATEARQKIKDLTEKAQSCFFCTEISSGQSVPVRPMSIQKVDEDGTLWFLSANDSHKNKEVSINNAVRLYFQESSYAGFIYIEGKAYISEDQQKIDELWKPILKTWFTEGRQDARISVIKVVPDKGYYWDTKHGKMVAGIKMLIGALTGKTLDDSIEGELTP